MPHSTDAVGRVFKNQMQWRVYTQDIPKQEAKMHKWSPDIKGIRKWLKKNRGKQFKTGEKQNKLESYLNPEKSRWVDPQILFLSRFPPGYLPSCSLCFWKNILLNSPKNPSFSLWPSPSWRKAPDISFSFPLFVSSSASHPRLHCSSRQQGWSPWPSAWSMACPCSWFPGRREKGAPTYPRCCPAPLMLYKKTKIPWLPKWGSTNLHVNYLYFNIYYLIYFQKLIYI